MTKKSTQYAYCSDSIVIYEWPNPFCEIIDISNTQNWTSVTIRTPEDAKALIESLEKFIESCSGDMSTNIEWPCANE